MQGFQLVFIYSGIYIHPYSSIITHDGCSRTFLFVTSSAIKRRLGPPLAADLQTQTPFSKNRAIHNLASDAKHSHARFFSSQVLSVPGPLLTLGLRQSTMFRLACLPLHALIVFYLSLSSAVNAAQEKVLSDPTPNRRGYTKGELIPVSCLNRTM